MAVRATIPAIADLQSALFADAPSGPPGLLYEPEFLSQEEERGLLAHIAALPFHGASYKEWTARRRVVSYGGRFDFDRNVLVEAAPLPPFLQPLRDKVARWCAVQPLAFQHALVSEYSTGTPLGWHRDAPCFEMVAGISLAGVARMRWRPYPPKAATARATFALDLPPRSAYIMRGAARWDWQHAVSPTRMLRYSITFRTLRGHKT
jgi:alkylated DNA repair dioxygenase AlkB